MESFTFIVLDSAGLHARPAALLATFCSSLTSEVLIGKQGREVDAKSALSIMTLGARLGDAVKFSLTGEQAQREAAKLKAFCERSLRPSDGRRIGEAAKEEGDSDELKKRLALLQASGFVDESGARDLNAIVEVLVETYNMPATDEALGAIVTHIAAALKRKRTGESIDPLGEAVVEQMRGSEVYPRAKEMQRMLLQRMENTLPDAERDFILVHLGGMLFELTREKRGESC